MRRRERIYRDRLMQSFSAVVIAIGIGIGLAIALDPKGPPWLGGIVGTCIVYMVWMIGWQSSVRLRPDGVVVASMFMLAFVPWESFKEFRVANGLKVVTTDGRAIRSLAFGGSLAGQVTGFRRMRRVAERMEADRRVLVGERDRDGPSAPVPGKAVTSRLRIHFAVWPVLAAAVPLELIGLLTTLLR
jgi:phosphotransferase system  glucose/maltose/N-acetylglucosamine-specific IIC component